MMVSTEMEEQQAQAQAQDNQDSQAASAGTVLDPETIREFIKQLEKQS